MGGGNGYLGDSRIGIRLGGDGMTSHFPRGIQGFYKRYERQDQVDGESK